MDSALRVEEVRSAISRLNLAAIHDSDSRRQWSAAQLEKSFEAIATPQQLHDAARDALRLLGGGMGSFQDVGTAEMADAVDGLYEALRRVL